MKRVKSRAAPGRRGGVEHRFGAHLSIAGGLHRALREALRLRCQTVQVFVKNQRQWRAPPLRDDDLGRWHDLLARPGFGPPVAHATYLINLASADRALQTRSRQAFETELRRCDALHIPYLVVHPGAAGQQNRAAALRRVATALDLIYDRKPAIRTMALLETTAGQGTTLGCTFEELAAILGHMRHARRVGVCIDTCHVFAAGWDIRDPDRYQAMIACAERTVGLERIRCWHLNDSRTDLGSRRDRHAHIGHGRIGPRGFHNVLADPRFVGLPMILETPKGTDPRGREWDAVNLRRLRTLASRASR